MSKETKAFDISKFYTRDNFEKGVPYEPVIDGEAVGITFHIINYNSVKAAKAVEVFGKVLDDLKKIKDPEEKKQKEIEANADLASALVVGWEEGSQGPVVIDGQPLEYTEAMCYALMLNSLPIANAIIEFAVKTKNFLGRSV